MKELATYVTDVTYMSSRYVESDEHGKQARRIAELEAENAQLRALLKLFMEFSRAGTLDALEDEEEVYNRAAAALGYKAAA